MQLEKKFFRYKAESVLGDLPAVVNKINEINTNPNVTLVFTSNIVACDGKFACVIQTKETIRGLKRGEH